MKNRNWSFGKRSRRIHCHRGMSAVKVRKECFRFTLTELLVVIGVIALLASLMLPALNIARRKVHATTCRSNLRQCGMALQMYLDRSDGIMPDVAAMPSLKLNSDPSLCDVLMPYLDNAENVFRCPGDNTVPLYFEQEGSSYQFHTPLGGKRVQDAFLTRRFGESETPVMYDYEPFHGTPGTPGASNYLFADSHVGAIK